MNSCDTKNYLRPKHEFSDFLWFFALGWMPVLVACLAIASSSLLWVLVYLVVMFFLGVVEIRFLCSHCHYYKQEKGKILHCQSMWGPTKFARPRQGPLSSFDKVMLFSFLILAFSFPIYWLVQQPKFLVIYLLSAVIMLVTLARYECTRCMFFDCPFNRVSTDIKNEFLRKTET